MTEYKSTKTQKYKNTKIQKHKKANLQKDVKNIKAKWRKKRNDHDTIYRAPMELKMSELLH